MTNPTRSSPTPRDVLRSLARHSKKAFLVFCLVVFCTVGWIVFKPSEYESVAKIYVRVGRENNTLDPSATTGQTVNIAQTLAAEVNSMLEIIGSCETASLVAKNVGVDTILANDLASDSEVPGNSEVLGEPRQSGAEKFKSWIYSVKAKISPGRFSESPDEEAVRLLLERSTFSAPKNSNVIVISCKAGHPELARAIASSWTNAFISEHLRVSRTEGSFYFFTQHTQEIESRLLHIEEELKEAKSAAGLVSIEGGRELLETQSNSIHSRLLDNQSSLDAAQAKTVKLEAILSSLPIRVETDQKTEQSPEGWYDLRGKLFELEIKEHELKAKFAASNPEVVAVEGQRKQVEKILESQEQSSAETVSGPNPTYQLFQQALLNEQALVVSLSAEKKTLEDQRSENLVELKALNENAVRIADLERQRLNMDTAYRESAASTEQARTLQAMETANISSVSRLQNASYSTIPAGLSRLKTLLLGLCLAVICAAVYTALAEYFDRSFVTATQVEQTLELPVLVSIPQGRRHFREVGG